MIYGCGSILARVPRVTSRDLLVSYGFDRGTGLDGLKWFFLKTLEDRYRRESYTSTGRRIGMFDSGYVLKQLVTKGDLELYALHLTFAEPSGGSLYGWAFESYVHKLALLKKLSVKFKPYDDRMAVYETLDVTDKQVTWLFKARTRKGCLESLYSEVESDMGKSLYLCPEFPTFPVVDSIYFNCSSKTVYYLKMVVAEEHSVDVDELLEIHSTLCDRLETAWTYKLILVLPSENKISAFKVKGAIKSALSNYLISLVVGFILV